MTYQGFFGKSHVKWTNSTIHASNRRRWPDASIGKLDWTCFSQSLYNDIDLFWGSHKTNRSKPDLGKQQSGTNQLTSSALKVQTVDMHTSKLLQCTTAQLTHYFFDSQCFDLKSALSVQLSVHKWLARPLDKRSTDAISHSMPSAIPGHQQFQAIAGHHMPYQSGQSCTSEIEKKGFSKLNSSIPTNFSAIISWYNMFTSRLSCCLGVMLKSQKNRIQC